MWSHIAQSCVAHAYQFHSAQNINQAKFIRKPTYLDKSLAFRGFSCQVIICCLLRVEVEIIVCTCTLIYSMMETTLEGRCISHLEWPGINIHSNRTNLRIVLQVRNDTWCTLSWRTIAYVPLVMLLANDNQWSPVKETVDEVLQTRVVLPQSKHSSPWLELVIAFH